MVVTSGCISKFYRPELDEQNLVETDTTNRQTVGDLTRAWGMQPIRVEGVSLVVRLEGTGSDPPPSEERDLLQAEMRTRKVDGTARVLASLDTAMVIISAVIPPGAQRGDPLDVFVRVPPGSDTSSLSGGWLMETRLLEFARINQQLATGHLSGLAQGAVLIDDFIECDNDPISRTRGRVLGGGRIVKDRLLGLAIRDENLSVQTSVRVGKAVNARFHVYDRGSKQGVATPKRNNFVELLVHPRYRDNLVRYMRVIQAITIREGEGGVVTRMESLGRRLAHAPSAANAAIQLEAIGAEGASLLREGLTSTDPEVRFYAAEALAYLNEPAATPVLAMAAKSVPAFRWRALTALSAMEATRAYEEVEKLLHSDSVETRYGAFRALQSMSPDDPAVAGEYLGEKFHYHQLTTEGPPLVHIALSHRPEIVLFGREHNLRHPVVLFAGNKIVIRSADDGALTVTKVSAGEEDREKRCSTKLDDVIRTAVDLGAEYVEVVQLLRGAKDNDSLVARLEFGALPKVGRTYQRGKRDEASGDTTDGEDQLAADTRIEVEKLLREHSSLELAPDPIDDAVSAYQERIGTKGAEPIGSGALVDPALGDSGEF